MSRTDKDRPYRVRIMDTTYARVEHHDHTPRYVMCVTHYLPGYRYVYGEGLRWIEDARAAGFRVGIPRLCDIDDPTPRRVYRWWNRCYYSLVIERPTDGPPPWYLHANWHDPERTRQRDQLRGAAREYNHHGEIDDFDFVNEQHRHRAGWNWW